MWQNLTISSHCASIDVDKTLSISFRYRRYRWNLCRYRNDIDDIVTVCRYRCRRNLVDIVTISTISTISYSWSVLDMYATSGGNIITLPKWGEFIFVLFLNLWNDKDYKKQTLVNTKKQIEVVVKGGHRIFKWDYSCDQVMHIDKMYNFEGLSFPLNCAFKWLHNTVIAM